MLNPKTQVETGIYDNLVNNPIINYYFFWGGGVDQGASIRQIFFKLSMNCIILGLGCLW